MYTNDGEYEGTVRSPENGPVVSLGNVIHTFMWEGKIYKVLHINDKPYIDLDGLYFEVYEDGKAWCIKPAVMEQMPLEFVEA